MIRFKELTTEKNATCVCKKTNDYPSGQQQRRERRKEKRDKMPSF